MVITRSGTSELSTFAPPGGDAPRASDHTCEICGSADAWWRNCKLVCRSCGGISKSCADL